MSQALADAVHTLTKPHLRKHGDTIGQEPALLDILADCIGNSGSGQSASSGGRSTPISLEAVAITQDIERVLNQEHPTPGLVRAPLARRINAWHTNTHQPHDALRMYEHVAGWNERIRELIEPTKKIPMRGMTCVRCGNTHLEKHGDEGVTYTPAITAYPDENPVRAECGVCGTEWSGRELHELAA